MTFDSITDNMKSIYKSKNHDYGDSFSRTIEEFGLTAAAIRMTDKLNRFKQLIKSPKAVTTETMEDTLLDLANYAVMTICVLKNDLSSNDSTAAI